MNVLKVNGASKKFSNNTILDKISFECRTGETVGVFGRNGTGKSTLLKLIYGILKSTSIKVEINNSEIKPEKIISSKKIAYLPQESFLPKELRVRDVISIFYKDEEQNKIFYAPRIASFDSKRIGQLSLGELRYLEFLLIANLDHPFLMLDEPFSMIEPLYIEQISNKLYELKKTKGIIITDHYYIDVLKVSDRFFLINNGQRVDVKNESDLIKNGYLTSKNKEKDYLSTKTTTGKE